MNFEEQMLILRALDAYAMKMEREQRLAKTSKCGEEAQTAQSLRDKLAAEWITPIFS